MGDITPEKVKSHFKDKIDWKFYNYLLFKITELQDKGVDSVLYVCLDMSEFNHDDRLYVYQSEVGYLNPQAGDEGTKNYFKNITNWHLEFIYRKHGFRYVIDIYAGEDDSENSFYNFDNTNANILWEQIKDKCIDLRSSYERKHSTLVFKKRN